MNDENDIAKYDSGIDMSPWQIHNQKYVNFNEYKYSNPEAFFYWLKAIEFEN
jgi:hypothetical protein